MADGIQLGTAYVQILPSAKGIQGRLSKEMEPEAEAAGKSSGGHLLASLGKTVAAGAAVVAGAAAALVSQSVKQYAEYEQLAGGAELLFGDAYDFIAEKAQGAYKTVQMSQNEYLNQVNGFAVGLKNSMGGNAEAAAELADKILTAEADIVAATGRDSEAIQNAFNGIMRGNYTMLDNLGLGIAGTQEGMAKVIESVNEWNAANGEATNYVMGNYADMESALVDYVEMQGLAGYASMEASQTITGSLSSMQSAWSNVLVAMSDDNADFDGALDALIDSVGQFAQNIIPRIGTALKGVASLVGELVPVIIAELPGLLGELLPAVIDIVFQLINQLAAMLPELVTTLIPILITAWTQLQLAIINLIPTLITSIVETLVAAIPVLVEGAVQAFSALAQALPVVITQIVEMLPGLITTLLDTLTENIPVLLEGAIQAFMALVEALPVVIEALVEALPQIIDSVINFLVENIPVLLDAAVQVLMALVDAVPVIAKTLWDAMPQILSSIINGLASLGSMLWNSVLQPALQAVWDWISNLGKSALDAGRTFLNNVIAFFQQLPGNVLQWLSKVISNVITWGSNLGKKFLDIGKNAVQGLWNGISNAVDWVIQKIKGFGSMILGAIKGVLGIHSPSTEFAWVGEMIDRGLAEGIEDNTKPITDAMHDLADLTTGTLNADLAVASSMDIPALGVSSTDSRFDRLLQSVEIIGSRLDSLQIVLDSGELVGGIAQRMDGALGNLQTQVKRGVLA